MHTAIKIIIPKEKGVVEEKRMIIPNTEFLVLTVLGQNRMTAPEISRKSKGKMSSASVYSLCSRLVGRDLLTKEESLTPVAGLMVSRKYYKPTYASMEVVA